MGLVFSAVFLSLGLAACGGGDTTSSASWDTETDTDAATDTDTEPGCLGSFTGEAGPGCCAPSGDPLPDRSRSSCVDGEWTCDEGTVCTCNGQVADYECLDSCKANLVELPFCVFSDHWECSTTAPVLSSDCD